jgi:hypothetical protein
MQQPSKQQILDLINQFEAHLKTDSTAVYENAIKAIQLLKQQILELYGEG